MAFRFCNSYRTLNVAQDLRAIFICPRTELCSLSLKHSLLKQPTNHFLLSPPSLFFFLIKKAAREEVTDRTLALQFNVCEPSGYMRAVQSAATVISGCAEVQMPGWQKPLLQHQIVPAGSWTRDLLS